MKHHLPCRDFDISNLTRHQAAVFEHMATRARAGLQREIDMHEHALNLPGASSSIIAEHRALLRECRREQDGLHVLIRRLTAARTAPLTEEERARLDRAREANPDLTSQEADLVTYGLLDVPAAQDLEAA